MRVLITGGAGFIGSHLAEYLRSLDIEVFIFDKSDHHLCSDFPMENFTFIEGDVQDKLSVDRAVENCDVIFHLAGVLGTDFLVGFPELAVKINTLGTINVLNAARNSGATLLYLSLLPEWNNPYMITKHAGERFCNMYYNEFGVPTIVARATHIYGPRQKWHPVKKAVPTFIMNALRGEPLKVYGTGEQLMDLLYVVDAAKALWECVESRKTIGQTLELGSGKGISVISLAKMIIELCKSDSKIEYEEMRPGEPNTPDSFAPANIDLLNSLLGFEPKVDLQMGLEQTIDWYRRLVQKKC